MVLCRPQWKSSASTRHRRGTVFLDLLIPLVISLWDPFEGASSPPAKAAHRRAPLLERRAERFQTDRKPDYLMPNQTRIRLGFPSRYWGQRVCARTTAGAGRTVPT